MATDPSWVQMNIVLCLSVFYTVGQFTVAFILARFGAPEYIQTDDWANGRRSGRNYEEFLEKWLGRWNVNYMTWGAGGFKIDVCYAFKNGGGGRLQKKKRSEKVLANTSYVVQLNSSSLLSSSSSSSSSMDYFAWPVPASTRCHRFLGRPRSLLPLG